MYRNMIYCYLEQQAIYDNVAFGFAEGEFGYAILGFFVGLGSFILAAICVPLLVAALAIGSSTLMMFATELGFFTFALGIVGVICSFIGGGQLANSMARRDFCESNYWNCAIKWRYTNPCCKTYGSSMTVNRGGCYDTKDS